MMKKLFFAALALLLLFPGCGSKKSKNNETSAASKERTKEEKPLEKAQEYYDKKGFEKFYEYVEDNGYFPVKDNFRHATPLLIAIRRRDVDSISLFIEKGASLAEVDWYSDTGLDYALEYFDEDIAAWAVNTAPYMCWSHQRGGEYPVMRIIRSCTNYDIIHTALQKTVNPNITSSGDFVKTLLMYAAQCNSDVRIIKDLLDKKADINRKNNNEWTALMYAARYNPNPLIAEYLLLSGADAGPNSAGLTVVMLAACSGHADVLSTVLKRTDAVNAQTKEGKTALMYACQNTQNIALIRCLLENFADINLKDQNGKTALMYALESYHSPDVPALLVTVGADCAAADTAGKSVKDYLENNAALKNSSIADLIAEKTKGEESKD